MGDMKVFDVLSRSFPGGWFKIDEGSVSATREVLEMNQCRTGLLSDADLFGVRPYVVAYGLRFKSKAGATLAISPNTLFNTAKQRLATVSVNIKQPNIKTKYSQVPLTAAEWEDVGLRVNSVASNLANEMIERQEGYDGLILSGGTVFKPLLAGVTGVNDSMRDMVSVPTWRNFDRLVSCATGAASTLGTIDDLCVIPACAFSGSGLFDYDRLPLALMTDANQGWSFEITRNKVMTDSLFPAASVNTEYYTVELWAYIVYTDKATANLSHGILYTTEKKPADASFNIEPKLYIDGSVRNVYDGSDPDAVAPFIPGVEYDDFFTQFSVGNLKLTIDNKQLYPLPSLPEYSHFVNAFNQQSRYLGSHPRIGLSPNNATTLFGTRNGGTSLNAASGLDNILGNTTLMPWFPIFYNDMAARGFGLQFMAEAGSQFKLKVDLTGTALTAGQLQRFAVIHVSEFWEEDIVPIRAAEVFGNPFNRSPLPSYLPKVDKISNKIPYVQKLVPSVSLR